jgi:hypothetical protein
MLQWTLSKEEQQKMFISDASKSYSTVDPIIKYTTKNSLRQHPLQAELQAQFVFKLAPQLARTQAVTLSKAPNGGMLGAPEVLQLCANMVHMTKARRVLDIGEVWLMVHACVLKQACSPVRVHWPGRWQCLMMERYGGWGQPCIVTFQLEQVCPPRGAC